MLLCASAINYMDRQALASASVRITQQFQLAQEHYGNLEWCFGWGFALGSLGFGFLVDRVSVRWVYPVVLLLWSAVGMLTGWVHSYHELLVCRGLLGLFEAGHWPCAIKTTQQLLGPSDRAMGNSVLQSGTSFGAILIPQIMRTVLTKDPSSWRLAFQIVGAMGLLWVAAWFALVRRGDLAVTPRSTQASSASGFWGVLMSRRMMVVLVVIALINTSWQTLRAWLPKFLQEGRGYAEGEALNFTSIFYVASDVGCLGAGAVAFALARRGWSVDRSRSWAFCLSSALAATALAVPFLQKGWALGVVLLCVAAGTLGVFPLYHALTQDLSPEHQGKVTGFGSVAAWMFGPPIQRLFGSHIDRTHSFDLGICVAGCLPLAAWLVLALFWTRRGTSPPISARRAPS